MNLQCRCWVRRLCFGKELFTYVYIYMCVHVSEELFSKTWSLNLALSLEHGFLDWRLTRFGKELFILTTMHYHDISAQVLSCAFLGDITCPWSHIMSMIIHHVHDHTSCPWSHITSMITHHVHDHTSCLALHIMSPIIYHVHVHIS